MKKKVIPTADKTFVVDEAILACVPVKDAEKLGFVPYKDSVVWNCPGCGREMWVGPKVRETHEKQKIPVRCMVCVLVEHKGQTLPIAPLTHKQMGE